MSESGITCGRCGSGNAAGSLTCHRCGALLAAYASPTGSEPVEASLPTTVAPTPPAPPPPAAATVPALRPATDAATAEPTERILDRAETAPPASGPPGVPTADEPLESPPGVDDSPPSDPVVTLGAAGATRDAEAGRLERADPITVEAPEVAVPPPISSALTGDPGVPPSPAATWGTAALPADVPNRQPHPTHVWPPRSFLPPRTAVNPGLIVGAVILGFCVLSAIGRALPLGSGGVILVLIVALAIVNALRKRQ